MNCPYCNKEAKWCENKELYGENIGRSYMCYLCKDCNAYVGCHQNSRKPLGTMANKELRKMRTLVHHKLDALWESPEERKALYQKLSDHFGKEIHVGESDLKQCEEIIEYLLNLEA